eukprot:2148665-Rhodomonas_salina.1
MSVPTSSSSSTASVATPSPAAGSTASSATPGSVAILEYQCQWSRGQLIVALAGTWASIGTSTPGRWQYPGYSRSLPGTFVSSELRKEISEVSRKWEFLGDDSR